MLVAMQAQSKSFKANKTKPIITFHCMADLIAMQVAECRLHRVIEK